MTLYGRTLAVHKIGDMAATESGHQLDRNVAGARGVKQEPTDERQPESAEVLTFKELK